MYRERRELEVLLVHPGGPFWVNKDLGAWSIPKGEVAPREQPLDGACREFQEETGWQPRGPFLPLGEVQQSSAKRVTVWAFQGDADPATVRSVHCELEWPPRSGRHISVPEVDRAAWFDLDEARERLLPGQRPFLDRLIAALAATAASRGEA